jgi:hypothetical protein
MHLRQAAVLTVFPALVLGIGLISCTDAAPTEPRDLHASLNSVPSSHAGAPNLGVDTITITRTTDIAAREGRAAYHNLKKHVRVSGAVGVKHGEAKPHAAALDTADGVDGLPVPLLSVNASSASAGLREPTGPRWAHSHAYGGTESAVIVSQGNGDAPASEIRLVQGRDTVLTI